MKKIITLFLFIFISGSIFGYSNNDKFTNDQISKISGNYLEGKLDFDNPVLVDVDYDGDFDALKFDDGNVEYYKNIGTQNDPVFILENRNFDKYSKALFIEPKMPYPVFFADKDGDGDMDLFVVRDKEFSKKQMKYEYKVSSAENTMDLDTGTLITIILVLVIVLLVLAILR